MIPKSMVTVAKIAVVLADLRLRFTETGEQIMMAVDDRDYRIINHKRADLAKQIQDWEAILAFIKTK